MNYFHKFSIAAMALTLILSTPSLFAASLSNQTSHYTKNLSKGMCDQHVWDMQMYLKDKGYVSDDYSKYVTGYFGPATFNAVKKMQRANGIAPTGIVGPKTRAFLDREYAQKMIADEAAYEKAKQDPNWHATGLLPTPKCIYDKIPVAPLPQ